MQSGELEEGSVIMHTQENLMFADAGAVPPESVSMVSYRPDCDASAGMGQYLSRPVLINTYNWTDSPTSGVLATFDPWRDFFNNPATRKKLDNFARLRAKLHVKFVVNASPFYYGAVRASYCPLDGGLRDTYATSGDQIKFSQMPGVMIYPQDMTSAELELPFLWPRAWLNATGASEFVEMGRISYVLYSQLRSANGATGNVTIRCYAWATDVELAGLTSGLSMQVDEYEASGVISGPATAVANVAAKLTDVPVIGHLARATEIGARAISGVASLFGYSNPPVIDDVHGFFPKSFHSFASVDTGVPMDKLSLDPKNEITVDKTVTGAPADDQLVISSFCGRQSYITGALWTEAYAPGTQLMLIPVTPRNYSTNAGVGQSIINSTPAAHVAMMFRQWRGGMCYTLRFVKSRYHTGRVQVSWDPERFPDVNAETTTVTRIIDLQVESEVSFMIPFKAKDPWLTTNNGGSNWAITPSGTVTANNSDHNGYLRVSVVNELTGPSPSQQIDVLLFAHTAPDFQVAVPRELPQWSYLTVQSLTCEQIAPVAIVATEPGTTAITVGETVASLRTLLHRTSLFHRQFVGNPESASGVLNTISHYMSVNYIPRFPTEYGFGNGGMNYASSLIGGPVSQFQYSPPTPLGWITNCFAGYRGGIVHQYNIGANGAALVDEISVERDSIDHIIFAPPAQANNRFSRKYDVVQPSTLARGTITFQNGIMRYNWGHRGMAMTNANTQSGISVVVPQYSKWKFRPAFMNRRDRIGIDTERDSVRVSVAARMGTTVAGQDQGWPVLSIYMAGGVDFDPIFFVCVPTLYSYSMPNAVDTF